MKPSRLGLELHADLDGLRVVLGGFGREREGAPKRARARRRNLRHGDDRARRLEVRAVVGGARADRDRAEPRGSEGVAPGLAPARGVPARAAVDRDLDRADPAADVARRAGHGDRPGDARAVRRRGDGRGGWSHVRRRGRRDEPALQGRGLRAEVGQEVHGRLLHAYVGGVVAAVVDVVEPPAPLHGAGPEHQSAAHVAVERQVVRPSARSVVRAVVQDPRRFVPRRASTAAPAPAGARRCRGPRPTRSPACWDPASRSARARASRRSCCARGAACRPPRAPASRRCSS